MSVTTSSNPNSPPAPIPVDRPEGFDHQRVWAAIVATIERDPVAAKTPW